jgi:pimeloyl-ACP methyl ester carboxylesterase
MAALFALNGFRVIAPSRPGFLGTPLDTGRTYEEQADALAALLNALGVDETAAVGFSGGGPPLFLLAARFPSRVRCLVGVSTVSGPFPPRTPRQRLLWTVAGHRVLLETVVRAFRFLAVRRPRVALQRGMAEETDLPRAALDALTRRIEADPVRRAFASRVYGGTMLSRAGERFPGQRNDDALLLGLHGLPLTGVRCPALLVGGARDPLRATPRLRRAGSGEPSRAGPTTVIAGCGSATGTGRTRRSCSAG